MLRAFASKQINDEVSFGKFKGFPIYWQILDKKDSKILLFCSEAIDCIKFNEWFGDTSWEHSTIRQYLNYDFYKEVFSNSERAVIIPSEQTRDKIFLLDATEAEHYLPTHDERKTRVTSYLRRLLPFASDKCRWWLRTAGKKPSQTAFVDGDGTINLEGDIATAQYNALRPALWIEIDIDNIK